MRRCCSLLVSLALASTSVGQDLGGGAPSGHGRVPRFALENWIPGLPTALRFDDLPPNQIATVGLISFGPGAFAIPGFAGTLVVDPFGAVTLAMSTARAPIGVLPLVTQGADLFLQGAWIDPIAGPGFTDGHVAHLFNPVVMVGNQRQSANSISVIDLVSRQIVDRLVNSENGSIAFSADRTRAYVCEPGSLRDLVTVYDLRVSPIAQLTQLPTTGGIRYRGEFDALGFRLFVPVHDGVDIFDTDPTSSSYHQYLGKIPALVIGSPGSIFTGPLDLAVTPDGQRLLIAYGETVTYPLPTQMGIVDINQVGLPQRSIPLTTGGTVFGLSTKSAVRVSPDGAFAYVVEFGFPAGIPGVVLGFANGALLSVIDLATESEVATIATNGLAQTEMAVDPKGRDLWIAQTDLAGLAQVLRIDVDRRSATRNTLRSTVTLDPVPYSAGNGAVGVGVTPDGGTVCISLVEDGAHPIPALVTLDSWTEQLFGSPIVVESLPATVGVQRE